VAAHRHADTPSPQRISPATGQRRLNDKLRHRRLVMLFWLVVVVGGVAAAGQASKRLTVEYSLPGEPGAQTSEQITQTFGNGGYTPPYLVSLTFPEGPDDRRARGPLAEGAAGHRCCLEYGLDGGKNRLGVSDDLGEITEIFLN
jgi:hypothetical protein